MSSTDGKNFKLVSLIIRAIDLLHTRRGKSTGANRTGTGEATAAVCNGRYPKKVGNIRSLSPFPQNQKKIN